MSCIRGEVFGFMLTVIWLHLEGMKCVCIGNGCFYKSECRCVENSFDTMPGELPKGQDTWVHPCNLAALTSSFPCALLSPTTIRKQILHFLWDWFKRRTVKAGKCYHLRLECHTPSERLTPACILNLNAVSLYQGFSHGFFRDVR